MEDVLLLMFNLIDNITCAKDVVDDMTSLASKGFCAGDQKGCVRLHVGYYESPMVNPRVCDQTQRGTTSISNDELVGLISGRMQDTLLTSLLCRACSRHFIPLQRCLTARTASMLANGRSSFRGLQRKCISCVRDIL